MPNKQKNTPIELIKVDDENEIGYIIEINGEIVKLMNTTLGRVEEWDIEDLRQCVKYL